MITPTNGIFLALFWHALEKKSKAKLIILDINDAVFLFNPRAHSTDSRERGQNCCGVSREMERACNAAVISLQSHRIAGNIFLDIHKLCRIRVTL